MSSSRAGTRTAVGTELWLPHGQRAGMRIGSCTHTHQVRIARPFAQTGPDRHVVRGAKSAGNEYSRMSFRAITTIVTCSVLGIGFPRLW